MRITGNTKNTTIIIFVETTEKRCLNSIPNVQIHVVTQENLKSMNVKIVRVGHSKMYKSER